MKQFLLIHSYSDFNKGDAAIIIATIQSLRSQYIGCHISLQSTFAAEDPYFIDEHQELRKYADAVYPSLFPQLFLKTRRGFVRYDTKSKHIALFKYTLKNLLNYVSIKLWGGLIWATNNERASLQAIKDSDIVISKGGSFLCSNGSLREDISLIRVMHPFFIAKLFRKKTIVLAQSLGPFESRFSRAIFRFFIKYIDKIYFREKESLFLLKKDGVHFPREKVAFCPDMAFNLDSSLGKKIFVPDSSKINIGITIVDFDFKSELSRKNYFAVFKNMFDELSRDYEVHFYIFPQVINRHPETEVEDLRLAREIIKESNNPRNVTLIEGNYECVDLVETYATMDVFVATRLHSSIFSTSRCVPTLNISYHGTKAEGTFELLGCGQYVFKIATVDPMVLDKAIREIIQNRKVIREQLSVSVQSIKKEIEHAIIALGSSNI